jgi:hypothetical protein
MKTQLLLSLFALTLIGCSYRNEDKAYYTRDQYKKQSLRTSSELSTRIDQIDPSKRTLDLTEEMNKEWQRLPWETIDDWIERIQNQLVLNNNLILQLRDKLSTVLENEKEVVNRLQVSIAANEKMRHMVDALAPKDEFAAADQQLGNTLPPANFRVHLVSRGETLYSIANYYYDDPGMVDEIMLWNQGWLRTPHQLLAGIALVLFDENAPEKNEQIVEEYINRIPAYQ